MIAIKSKQSKMLFCVLCFLMVGCILITGCGQPNGITDNNEKSNEKQDAGLNNDSSDNNDGNGADVESTGLESGFDFSSGSACVQPGYEFLAYRSDKTEFSIEDVTFDIFYGGHWLTDKDIEFNFDCSYNYPEFDLYIKNDDGNRIDIKHVEEEFVSVKYGCDYAYDEKGQLVKVEYSYSESITIPQELFTKESGVIAIYIIGDAYARGKLCYSNYTIARAFIRYKLINGKVVLSTGSEWDMQKGN